MDTKTRTHTQTADWHWCGGSCQLHANPVFCNPLESCSYSPSTSLSLVFPSPSVSPTTSHLHQSSTHTCTDWCEHIHQPEHRRLCLFPACQPLNARIAVFLYHSSLSLSSSACLSLPSFTLFSPQRLSSCWSSLRCSGKSIVGVIKSVHVWVCVFSR